MDALAVTDTLRRKLESMPPDYPLTALIMKFATGHKEQIVSNGSTRLLPGDVI